MDWLSRVRSEPPTVRTGYHAPQLLDSPITPQRAAKTRDPNAPDYRYQVNQKCIYERYLPGGSYVGAHIQRLQSGFYDSDVIHEDLLENVRFVAINFVFHPHRRDYRFKSATISLAIHHTSEQKPTPLDRVRNSVGLDIHSDHDHATQTDTVSNALVRSREYLPAALPKHKPASCRPKFIRHAPHLLFGSVSPETLDWSFNIAGSVGVAQGPVSAALKPSYTRKSSYKLYEMMRIQGSVRTLRGWYDHQYDVEDGELVWTLEENQLQKSGLPREFTFVMLLTKGSGGFEPSDDVTLGIDISPQVSGPLGGTYSNFVMSLPQFQPCRNETVDLDEEIGQVFEPSLPGRGFNFANLASNFDDFVWMPGTTYSTTDNAAAQDNLGPSTAAPQSQSNRQQSQQAQLPAPQTQQQQRQITSRPAGDTTLNLRVILETSRGSPVPITNGNQVNNILPYLQLKQPSRDPSPLPPSVSGSRKSKRSIVITSRAPPSGQAQDKGIRHSYADPYSQSRHISSGSASSQTHLRQVSHTHSLRKSRSRSGLDKEYIRSESPIETRETKTHSPKFHDAKTEISPPSTSTADREFGPSIPTGNEDDGDVDESKGKTPEYGDERELKYGDERPEQNLDGVQQDQIQRLVPSQKDEEDPFTPASRYGRFPSLSQSYSHAEQARAAHSSGHIGSTQERLETPPVPSLIESSRFVETEEHGQTRPTAEEEPQAESARELPAFPSSPPQTENPLPISEEDQHVESGPQYQAGPPPESQDRDIELSTPPHAHQAVPEIADLPPSPKIETVRDLSTASTSQIQQPVPKPDTTRELSTPPLHTQSTTKTPTPPPHPGTNTPQASAPHPPLPQPQRARPSPQTQLPASPAFRTPPSTKHPVLPDNLSTNPPRTGMTRLQNGRPLLHPAPTLLLEIEVFGQGKPLRERWHCKIKRSLKHGLHL